MPIKINIADLHRPSVIVDFADATLKIPFRHTIDVFWEVKNSESDLGGGWAISLDNGFLNETCFGASQNVFFCVSPKQFTKQRILNPPSTMIMTISSETATNIWTDASVFGKKMSDDFQARSLEDVSPPDLARKFLKSSGATWNKICMNYK